MECAYILYTSLIHLDPHIGVNLRENIYFLDLQMWNKNKRDKAIAKLIDKTALRQKTNRAQQQEMLAVSQFSSHIFVKAQTRWSGHTFFCIEKPL